MKPKRRIVAKAVIPVAGLGTRMGPITKSVPKSMFPVVDSRGRLRPLVHHVCMEAAAAGVERVGIVVGPHSTDMLHRYFAAAASSSAAELPVDVEFVNQPAARGLGDALACAEHFVAGEPFLMLLGDHVWVADDRARPCAAQVVEAYGEHRGAAMIGMQTVGADRLESVGVARGRLLAGNVYRCGAVLEKPDLERARRELVSPDLPQDRFLAHGGIYLFTPEIFDCLRELSRAYRAAGEELELTAAQDVLRRRHGDDYLLVRIAGRCIDAGHPAGYADAFEALRAAPCHV